MVVDFLPDWYAVTPARPHQLAHDVLSVAPAIALLAVASWFVAADDECLLDDTCCLFFRAREPSPVGPWPK